MEQPKCLEIVQPVDSQQDESCLTFVLNGEDHTLGNSLRYIVMKNPETQFCGYNIPHPSENKINLRIQTNGVSAKDVFRTGLSDLHSVCEHILSRFQETVDSYKSRRVEQNRNDQDEGLSDDSSNENSNNDDEPMEEG